MTYLSVGAGSSFLAALLLAGCSATRTESDTAIGGSPTVEATIHVCSSCHGVGGRSGSPNFPNLAAQQRDYLVAQLGAFRDHSRADPHAHTYMWGMAAKLDFATIAGIAGFYASQPPAKPTADVDPALTVGRRIFEEGIADRSVPACAGCHGAAAEGAGEVPRLASQQSAYVERQLGYFRENLRANEIMHQTSVGLTPAEAEAVARFVASL